MKPILNVITSLNRTTYLTAMVDSMRPLHEFFIVNWIPVITGEPKETIGEAWNIGVSRVNWEGDWCILLDDDNAIHPDFAKVFRADLDAYGDEIDLFLFRQLDERKNPRQCTWNPILRTGAVDAAQFGFRALLARQTPFPEINLNPDGNWADLLSVRSLRVRQSEAITLYNALRQ